MVHLLPLMNKHLSTMSRSLEFTAGLTLRAAHCILNDVPVCYKACSGHCDGSWGSGRSKERGARLLQSSKCNLGDLESGSETEWTGVSDVLHIEEEEGERKGKERGKRETELG